jgi:signal transduction histidine kinase
MDMIEDIQIMLFFASFVLIFIFGGILYFIALKIAKKTIEPIKKSEEMARSYNHHIAHELKTPLSIIKSDLELAKRDPASLDSHIASAQEEVVLMRKTIDNLLFLAQKEAKKSVSNILLSDLLVETEREMQKLYEPKKLTFDFRGEKKTTILADDGLLKVLLNNLFDNA